MSEWSNLFRRLTAETVSELVGYNTILMQLITRKGFTAKSVSLEIFPGMDVDQSAIM